MSENQESFDFMRLKEYTVGCRVKGETETQIYKIEAIDHTQAAQFVAEGVAGSHTFLTLVPKDVE